MKNETAIKLKEVSFSYGGPLILEGINLTVKRGEFIGLVGPNGGGKSTLIKIVLGLLEPDRGRVTVLGRPPQEARQSMGYVPQYVAFQRDFPITVAEAVLLGRLGKTRSLGGYRKQDKEIARRVMEEVEIADLKDRYLNTLSGGQLQRVLIARALASEPAILILDEPTANIDQRLEEDIFDLFKQLNARMTLMVVSHDIGFISHYVTGVACLNRTLICHAAGDITGEVIQDLYRVPVHMIEHRH